MAIQPIDLSTVYSQMDNVSKFNASQNQIVQASNQQQQVVAAQQELEKSKTVQEAAKDQAQAEKLNPDGKSYSKNENSDSAKKQKDDTDETAAERHYTEIKDPRLGRHIDITG